jgi:hypothetical protein
VPSVGLASSVGTSGRRERWPPPRRRAGKTPTSVRGRRRWHGTSRGCSTTRRPTGEPSGHTTPTSGGARSTATRTGRSGRWATDSPRSSATATTRWDSRPRQGMSGSTRSPTKLSERRVSPSRRRDRSRPPWVERARHRSSSTRRGRGRAPRRGLVYRLSAPAHGRRCLRGLARDVRRR